MSWKHTFISNGFILAAGLIGGVLSARLLGVEDRGLLAALIFWPHFLVGITTLGINDAVVVRVAREGATKQLTNTVVLLSFVLALLPIIAGTSMMPWLLGSDRADQVLFACLYLVLLAPTSFVAINLLAIDQGNLDFRKFNFQRVIQAGLYPFLLLVLWPLGALNVTNAAISVLAGTVLVALMRLWSNRNCLFARPSIQDARRLLGAGWRIHSVDLLTHLSTQLDKMVLIYFSNNTTLGLYVAAQTLANAMQGLITQTYVNQLLPRAANSFDAMELAATLKKLLLVSVLVAIAVLIVLPLTIAVLFGDEFRDATGIARVLSIAAMLAGIKRSLVYLLRASGRHRSSFTSELVAVVIIAIGALPSIEWQGALGLSCVIALAQGGSLLAIWRGFTKATSMNLRHVLSA